MIIIDNKFELGQEIFNITKKNNVWVVREKPLKILCIYYKHKFHGETDVLYNIHPYGKAREENMFSDYDTALEECKKRNKEEKERRNKL